MFQNEKAFTLIEMLIVLLVITVLLLLIIPNITRKTESIHDHGCDALVQLVQAQVVAYELDKGSLPTKLDDLVKDNYISNDQTTCKNGKQLEITNGQVRYE